MKKVFLGILLLVLASPALAHQQVWQCFAQSPTWWGHSGEFKTKKAAELFSVAVCASGTAVGLKCVVIDCNYSYKPQPKHMSEVHHVNPSKDTWSRTYEHKHK